MFGLPGGFMKQAAKAMQGWQKPAYEAMSHGMRNLSVRDLMDARDGGRRAPIGGLQRGQQRGQQRSQAKGPDHGFYAGKTEADLKGAAMSALSSAYDLSGPRFNPIRPYLQGGVQ